MSTKKKKTTEKGPQSKPSSISIILPLSNIANEVDAILNPLKELTQNWSGQTEILAIDLESDDETVSALEKHEYFSGLLENSQARLFHAASLGEGLTNAAYEANGDHIVTWTNSSAVTPKVVRQWAQKHGGKLPANQIITGQRALKNKEAKEAIEEIREKEGTTGQKFKTCTTLRITDPENPVKIYPAPIARYLFANTNPNSPSFEAEALHRAQLEGINIDEQPVKFSEGTSFGHKQSSNLLKTLGRALAFKFNYQLREPIQALLKNKPIDRPSELKPPQYGSRLAFTLLLLSLFFFMPAISFDYGITGDENLQHNYGEKLVDYYSSFGEDQSALEYKNLYLYGGLFETIASGAAQAINPMFEKNYEYEIRHVFNALAGFLALLMTGLFGKYLGRWRGGLLAILFLVLSPRFFGHSMNNPKDIPFAAFYIMALYFMIKFFKEFPNPTKRTITWLVVGIACAINVRIGGLLLIAYFGLFGLIELGRYFYVEKINANLRSDYFRKAVRYGALVVILGYLGGLVFWPYGHQGPFSNPFQALGQMSDFPVNITILFNGTEMKSANVPWNYILTYLWYTTPIIAILGFASFLLYIPFARGIKKTHYLLFILFAVIFPAFYIVYRGSNLYDCIRQVLFIYPPLILLSSYATNEIYGQIHKKSVQTGFAVLLGILLILPLQYMVRNHPHQVVYYNEIMGGIDNAFGQYEMDYWGNSTKPAAQWLGKHIQANHDSDSTIKVTANFLASTRLVLSRYHDSLNYEYSSFDERSRKDWDYAVYVARFISPSILKNHWPPNGTIHAVKANNTAITCVIKRESHQDYKGFQQMNQQNLQQAIRHFQNYLEVDETNGAVMTALARCYLQQNQVQKAQELVNKALEINPSNIRALGLQGSIYKQQGNYQAAIRSFEKALQQNQGYARAYLELGELYYRQRQPRQALRYLNYLRQISPRLYQRAEKLVQRCQQMLKQ